MQNYAIKDFSDQEKLDFLNYDFSFKVIGGFLDTIALEEIVRIKYCPCQKTITVKGYR